MNCPKCDSNDYYNVSTYMMNLPQGTECLSCGFKTGLDKNENLIENER